MFIYQEKSSAIPADYGTTAMLPRPQALSYWRNRLESFGLGFLA
ncbi:MAG: hypothetical protein ACI8XQ_001127, partial [Bermanella sp.]